MTEVEEGQTSVGSNCKINDEYLTTGDLDVGTGNWSKD